ncbi:MAG: glucose 1-dehydrogenase [Alphaproteobacteria bacterium]|nr:glucose 1-dehydrogenase [Alphaproteobacteria bacterium]
MAGRLDGKVALVTGGTRGIGEAVATAFAREGATTVVVSRKQPNVDAAVARIRDASGSDAVSGHALHMGDEDAIADTVAAIADAHGPIDVLVNNAASNPYFGPMIGIDAGAWHKTFEVNVRGPFVLATQVAQRLMAAERPGSVIMMSSIMGLRAAAMQGVYGMTKAALISMVQTLAVELGPAGIRVNAIAPGLVDTKFASALTTSPEILKMFTDHTALGHIAQPDDIAGAAVFLASDEARYVTGQTLAVDGGYLVR